MMNPQFKMDIEIINKNLHVDLYGMSGRIPHYDYGRAGQKLMYAVWKELTTKNLRHKGINYWVYDHDEIMFAGIELETPPDKHSAFERRRINLSKYAYCKHIGPCDQLTDVLTSMKDELTNRALKFNYPYLEIYGQWTDNEALLETELVLSLE